MAAITQPLSPQDTVYQQSRRWMYASCFDAIAFDLRSFIRVTQGRHGQPSAIVLDRRTLQTSCERGPRAGYACYKRRRGRNAHMAIDTPDHLLTAYVMPTDEQKCAQVKRRCAAGQQANGRTVELPWADKCYTGK